MRNDMENDYVIQLKCKDKDSEGNGKLRLFGADDSDSNSERQKGDEVDDYFKFTGKGNKNCKSVVDWLRQNGRHRFPSLFLLAQDTTMAMGLSIASESAFPNSGDIISSKGSRLNDRNIRFHANEFTVRALSTCADQGCSRIRIKQSRGHNDGGGAHHGHLIKISIDRI